MAFLTIAATLVFISHARSDREHASNIEKRLEKAGCKVWRDDNLQAGDRWEREIEKAIGRADVMLFLIGTSCDTCRDELHRARRLGKRIVPVLLSPEAWEHIPLLAEQFQRIEEDRVTDLCLPPAK